MREDETPLGWIRPRDCTLPIVAIPVHCRPQKQEGGRKQNDDLQDAYGGERRIAESLQGVLLRTPPSEALPSLSLETFYEAVLEEATVGGDSFDAFALKGNMTALVVMDASDKGLAAAERVAEIRFALPAFLREHSDPA